MNTLLSAPYTKCQIIPGDVECLIAECDNLTDEGLTDGITTWPICSTHLPAVSFGLALANLEARRREQQGVT